MQSLSSGKLLGTAMSKSIKHALPQFLMSALFLASLSAEAINAPPPIVRKTGFLIARDILKAFYPESFGSKRYLNVYTGQPVDDEAWGDFSGFEFKVSRFSPGVSWNPTWDEKTQDYKKVPENTGFLEGRIWMGNRDQVNSFVAAGELAHSDQLQNLQSLVQTHPEWSDKQAVDALKAAGAKYGPAEKDQLMNSLNLIEKTKFLATTKIVSAAFQNLPADHVGSYAVGAFEWVIQAEAVGPHNSRLTYTFWFEPFEGKLIQIHRQGAPVG